MAVDDLKRPLSLAKRQTGDFVRWLKKLNFQTLAAGLAAGVIFIVFIWSRFFGDPLGGEPVAVVAIEKPSAADLNTGEGGGSGDALVLRPDDGSGTGQPGQSDDSTQIRIFRGNEAEPQVIPVPRSTADGGSATPGEVVVIQPGVETQVTSLGPVPDSDLIERTQFGLLPQRGPAGKIPAEIYARPFDIERFQQPGSPPIVAILVTGMGLNGSLTDEAIRVLPKEVTLAFAPYGNNLQDWVSRSRQDGHEVFLQIPMEPFDFPDNDPGPQTLLASGDAAENTERLYWSMGRFVGYAGVTNYMGGRFTATPDALKPFLLELKRRGLLYVGDGSSPRSLAPDMARDIALLASSADVVLDAVPSPDALSVALEKLEVIAHERGAAIGTVSALPVGITAIAEWSRTLSARGLQLAPVTAVVSYHNARRS